MDKVSKWYAEAGHVWPPTNKEYRYNTPLIRRPNGAWLIGLVCVMSAGTLVCTIMGRREGGVEGERGE